MKKIEVGSLCMCSWMEWGREILEVCLVVDKVKFYHGFENPYQFTILRNCGKFHKLHSNGMLKVIQ